MNTFQILCLALALDFVFGDPERIWKRIPHPTVMMGVVINALDTGLNTGSLRQIKGIAAAAFIAVAGLAIGLFIDALPDFGILDVVILSIFLAHKSLIDHVRAVANALQTSLQHGQQEVAKIVGRDVHSLDETGVSAAAIESGAENFSDGFVAPVFWFLIFGLPGLLMYKFINTADSMIGHLNEKYAAFGFGAAKLDDLLNWIPARLCGGLICIVHRSKEAFDLMLSEAPLHRSPNAGWPEAAMAAVLDIRLSGPRSYDDDEESDDLYINPMGQKVLNGDTVLASVAVLNRCWLVLFAMSVAIAGLTWLF